MWRKKDFSQTDLNILRYTDAKEATLNIMTNTCKTLRWAEMASTLDFKRRSQVELQSKEEPVIGNHLEETFE